MLAFFVQRKPRSQVQYILQPRDDNEFERMQKEALKVQL